MEEKVQVVKGIESDRPILCLCRWSSHLIGMEMFRFFSQVEMFSSLSLSSRQNEQDMSIFPESQANCFFSMIDCFVVFLNKVRKQVRKPKPTNQAPTCTYKDGRMDGRLFLP